MVIWIDNTNVILTHSPSPFSHLFLLRNAGELSLPIINGPTEGILITCCIHFWTAYVGGNWWLEESATFGITRNAAFAYFCSFVAIVTILSNVFNVIMAVKADPKFSLPVALTRMFPLLLIIAMSTLWVYFSPSNIMQNHPRLVLWALALLFSKLVTQLMIAHLCDEEYHPFGRTISVVCFLACHTAYNLYQQVVEGGAVVDEKMVLFEFFGIGLVAYVHLISHLIWEVTTVLNIKCFKIPYDKGGLKKKN